MTRCHTLTFSIIGCLMLAAYSLSYGTPAGATATVFNFTPYNCLLTAYDTSVHCSDGDTLIILNAAPSQFPANYFLERNGVIIDTVSSVPGDTIWRTSVTPGDSQLSIRVWSQPGSCYGQRFTLLRSSGMEAYDNGPVLIQRGYDLAIRNLNSRMHIRVHTMTGRVITDCTTGPTDRFLLSIQEGSPQLAVVILESNAGSWVWKILLP